MKTENLYMIWAHPRVDSLTAHVVEEMQHQATAQGMHITSLDLYRSQFDPVLKTADEPDWDNPTKLYSPEVHQLFAELMEQDTIVVVFPVWWYSFPAILKGYFDRVWNYGLAYGEENQLKDKKIRFIALVGGAQAGFQQYGWEKNMTDYVLNGMNYLGIKNAKIDFLYNTIGLDKKVGADHYQQLFAQARSVIQQCSL